ncbi:RAB44 protein, partial [Nothoprocta pentlandii]|nr:RAB44 protein [Nothoprocta pentlandii]
LGSSRRRQLREPPAEPSAEQEVPDLQRVREQEHRAFVPHADLQELQPEGSPGSREELQVVLTGLGAGGTGCLTDQPFTDGLWQELGSQQVTHEHHTLGTASPEAGGPNATSSEGVDGEGREHFSAFMEQLGTDDVLEDRELRELWVKLWQDKPWLLGNLEDFLAKMRWRIQEAKSEREALEVLLNQRVAEHGREVQQLCEALEQQMRRETQRLEQESSARSLQQGTELWRALDLRESQVRRLLSAQTELETRCRSLRRSRDAAGTEKQRLERSNRRLQERLQRVRLQLRDTQARLRAARDT